MVNGLWDEMEKDSGFWERTSLNTLMNAVRTVLMALIGIMLVPYYVDTLGMATYGIIPLATTMTSYISMFTDSLLTAYSRHATIAIERDDDAQGTLNTVVFGVIRMCAAMIPVAAVVALATPFLFDVAGNAFVDVAVMFFLIITSSLVFTVASTYNCVFYAFNKTYVMYAIRIVYSLVQVGLIVLFFLILGPSLIWIGIAYFASSLVLAAASVIAAKRMYPSFKLDRKGFDLQRFKGMSTLGIWNVVQKIGNMLYIQASLVLVNLYLGSEAGGQFAIVSSLISMIHTACYSFTAPFDPLIYACYADNDNEKLASIMSTGMRVTGLLVAFPIAFVMMFPSEILVAWVGPECEGLGDIVRIAAAATPVAFMRINTLSFYTVVIGVVNVIFTVLALTIFEMGIEGAMGVWMISTFILTIYTILFNERITSVRTFRYTKEVVLGYAVMLLSIGALYGLSQVIEVESTWLFLIPLAAVTYIVYLVFAWFLMGGTSRSMLLAALPSGISSRIPKFMR